MEQELCVTWMDGNIKKRGDVDLIYISQENTKKKKKKKKKEMLRYLKSCQIQDGLELFCAFQMKTIISIC